MRTTARSQIVRHQANTHGSTLPPRPLMAAGGQMRTTRPDPETQREPSPIPALSLSVEGAAKALGLGRTFVFQLIKEGRLKAVKIGRRTLIPVAECEAFLSRLGGAA